MDSLQIELEYKDINKKVVYYFATPAEMVKFAGLCIGDKSSADADFTLTADLAAECSKVNTLAIQYGLSMSSAALIRDLYTYNRIVKRNYHISINGVNYSCRPVITLMFKRAK